MNTPFTPIPTPFPSHPIPYSPHPLPNPSRMWGTVTMHGRADAAAAERATFKAALWQHVAVEVPNADDLAAVVRARFGRLSRAAEGLVSAAGSKWRQIV